MDAEHVQRLVVENTPRLQFGNGVGDVLAHGVGAMLLVIRHTRMALLHFEAMAEVSPRSQTDLAIRILHEVLFRRSRRHVHDPALVGRLVDGLAVCPWVVHNNSDPTPCAKIANLWCGGMITQ